ncbi:MAG: FAD-binding oxidoreductase [Acetobacteraceae bacterium]|nr:FAD-binding oxidoreductase [Acetobacteraceae bacterium]
MRHLLDTIPSDDALPASADVVVIGGGIAGASAAYWLARRGVSVALLEKGLVGAEQSSRNWGFCRKQGRDHGEIPLVRESVEMWAGMAEEIGADVGWVRSGVLFVSNDEAQLAQWERWAEYAGTQQVHSHVLGTAEVAALLPGSSQTWRGGLHTPSDGRAEPSKAVPAIAAAARRRGATIHQGCAARGIETEAGAVAMVVTEKGTIRTRTVLCAGGAWTTMFCRRHGIRLPQLSVRASVLETTAVPEVVGLNLSTPGFSCRRTLDGGYIVAMSGTGTFPITPDAFRYLGDFWPTLLARRAKLKLRLGPEFFTALFASGKWALDAASPFEAVRVLNPPPDLPLLEGGLARFKASFPAAESARIERSWGSMIETSPDAVPVIDAVPSLPGFFIATGFSGHGFGIGPAAGRLAADLLSGAPPIVDPTPFRYARMVDGSRLRPNAGL